MSTRLAVIRPEPGWTATAEVARKLGLEVVGHPLFVAEPLPWSPPDASDLDGLLVGSANVFRHGGMGLAGLKHLPVLAVGERTAEEARKAGFEVETIGKGGLQALIAALDSTPRRLLRLAGEQRVELDLPAHISIEEVVTYRVAPQPIEPAFISQLESRAMTALHSGEAAKHFRRECDKHGIDIASLSLIALGPRIADMAGEGWKSIHIAETPDEAALLATALTLCK